MAELSSIAVAISTVGRRPALSRCLDSLAEGKLRPAEVVVVDQSTDGAAARAAHRLQDRLRLRIEEQACRGLAVGQNAAVKLTTQPVVAILDDDCVADSAWLATISQAFDAVPELAAVTGRVLPLGAEAPGLYGVSLRTSEARRDFERGAFPWDVGSGNNFAFRREWFERVNGCDIRLGPGSPGRGGVDMDLFHRLLRAGARIRYEPDAVVYHERTRLHGRLARRLDYGYGMGAACAMWFRSGDKQAVPTLAAWARLRTDLLVDELRRHNWRSLPEEAIVLGSTAAGVVYGIRRGRRDV